MLRDYGTNYGTFLNDVPVSNKLRLLFNGDLIYIMGLKIVIVGDNIFVNNPFNRVTYNKQKFQLINRERKILASIDKDSENANLFSEEDYLLEHQE